MSCGKDGGCLKIANEVYHALQSDVTNDGNILLNQLDNIMNDLNAIKPPEDYLGEKVQSRIKEIGNNLETDRENLYGKLKVIDEFIDAKIKEHLVHAKDWESAFIKNKQNNNQNDYHNSFQKPNFIKE